MNNLPEQMAKAHWKSEIKKSKSELTAIIPKDEKHLDDLWEGALESAKAGPLLHMKAALEILKNPPEEFLEAMVVRVYRKINMCSEKETIQAALIAAIEQTLGDEDE